MPYALRLISLRLSINLMRGDIQRKKEVRLILFNQGFLVLLYFYPAERRNALGAVLLGIASGK